MVYLTFIYWSYEWFFFDDMLSHILFEELYGKGDITTKELFWDISTCKFESNKYLKQLFLRIVYVRLWNVNLFFSVKLNINATAMK
jgi:hypothetical protein